MITDIVMPNLGATGADVVLNEWLVKPGDLVKAGTPIFVVTTDKATIEVETFQEGYIREQPVARDGQVVLRLMMTANLSVDHRLVDGIAAARFMDALKQVLENPLQLALEGPEEASR